MLKPMQLLALRHLLLFSPFSSLFSPSSSSLFCPSSSSLSSPPSSLLLLSSTRLKRYYSKETSAMLWSPI